MASEKRLIYLQDAVKLLRGKCVAKYPNSFLMGLLASATEIEQIPTVDAVEVVRCKDCKHWKPIHEHIPHMECNIFCGAYDHGYPTGADDFCSYGERKDNE